MCAIDAAAGPELVHGKIGTRITAGNADKCRPVQPIVYSGGETARFHIEIGSAGVALQRGATAEASGPSPPHARLIVAIAEVRHRLDV